MTPKLIETIKSLRKASFNVNETVSLLSHNRVIYWSWGVSNLINFQDKALVMKVRGHHHKGYVAITLDYSDTYNVYILSTTGKIIDEYEMIYFDCLVSTIDDRIENVSEYINKSKIGV